MSFTFQQQQKVFSMNEIKHGKKTNRDNINDQYEN